MIVWRADRFGLAQLHQLRGRVGRGNRRGQVVLLTDEEQAVGERTLKRLRTLATFDRLGAGFDISAQDLDMRGGGDLLGDTQAGHMKLIGIDLYQHLLGHGAASGAWRRCRTLDARAASGNSGHAAGDMDPRARRAIDALHASRSHRRRSCDSTRFEEELVDRFGPMPDAGVEPDRARAICGWQREMLASGGWTPGLRRSH
jgi:transcription-repair coupling factor (superfamily II helicase)